jgi:hypothetical protein
MALKSRFSSVPASGPKPACMPVCSCLADFFREELLKHHRCLEQQREYYSDIAIAQAEEALSRILGQLDTLCQRDDACEFMNRLLRQFDAVTKLSAWTEPQHLH